MTLQEKKNQLLTERGKDKHYITGFEDGANWQRNSVWHDMSEKPNFPCDILYLFVNGVVSVYNFDEKGCNETRRVSFRCLEIGKWAYVDNIIPNLE